MKVTSNTLKLLLLRLVNNILRNIELLIDDFSLANKLGYYVNLQLLFYPNRPNSNDLVWKLVLFAA